MLHDYLAKVLKEILPHLFLSTMTYFNIVPAVFSIFLQRRKCVARCFVYFRVSITQFFILQTCARPFQIHSEKLSTRTAV